MKKLTLFLLVIFTFLLENVNPTSRLLLGSGLFLVLRWNGIMNELQGIDVNPEINIKDLYQEIRREADIDEDILFELSIGTQKLSKHDENKHLYDLSVGGKGSIIDITRIEKENQIKSLLNMFHQQVQEKIFGHHLYERMKQYIDSSRTQRENPSDIISEIFKRETIMMEYGYGSEKTKIFQSPEKKGWNQYHLDDDNDIVIDTLSVTLDALHEHDISINSINWSSMPSTIKRLQICEYRDIIIVSLEINIAQLTMLKELKLYGISQITFDEETVKAWRELEKIEINGGSLQLNSTNMEQLNKFEKLKEINIRDYSVNHLQEIDINLLKDLLNLEVLCLYGIKISNIEQIGKLTKLTVMNLWNVRLESNIFDFTILESLKSLEALYLRSIGLQSVITTKLGELGSIKHLILTGNELNKFDTRPLIKLKRLKEIDLSHNPLKEFNLIPLTKLADLKTINLKHTQIRTLNLKLFCKERPIKLINDQELNIYIVRSTLNEVKKHKDAFMKQINSVRYIVTANDPLNIQRKKLPVKYDESGLVTVLKKD